MRKFMACTLRGLHITGSDLFDEEAIVLDPDHCEMSGFQPMTFVDIFSKNRTAVISAYVIYGEPGSRCCIVNGAAARLFQIGDAVSVRSSIFLHENEILTFSPRLLTFDSDNRLTGRAIYQTSLTTDGRLALDVHRDSGYDDRDMEV
jgi:aspartate 1-decarboxylase